MQSRWKQPGTLLTRWSLLAVMTFMPQVARTQPETPSKGITAGLLAKAIAGDPVAQYQVGWHYEHPDATWCEGYTESEGSLHDYVQAALWYRKAADKGNAAAQYDLGDLYLFGKGVPVDYTLGIMWLRKAAEQGHPAAQTDLAHFYLRNL